MKWCLHKEGGWVDITTLAEEGRTYLDNNCGGIQREMRTCPRCGDFTPPENDVTGEGAVYWKITDEPFCSMECVVGYHRTWLEAEQRRFRSSFPPGTPEPNWLHWSG